MIITSEILQRNQNNKTKQVFEQNEITNFQTWIGFLSYHKMGENQTESETKPKRGRKPI
jgi:hypothetical protein